MPTEHKWVLIVDDEVGDALIIETMLKALGKSLSVVSVGSAEEALEQLAHRPFDLLVTDLRMPGMSGLELARRVKDTHPQTCTILVTAYASDEVEAEIRQLPSLAYLSKPFPVALFMQTVEQVLQAEMGEGALPASSDDWGGAVQRALATLRRGAEARCALLVDGTGQVVAQAGTLDGLPKTVLPLLVEEASITARLHRDLEGGAEVSLHHYEGSRYQVYTAVATDIPFLLIVLSQQTPLRRSGVVWLFLRRALQELRRLPWVEDSLEATAFGSLTPSQARALGLLPEESETKESQNERC